MNKIRLLIVDDSAFMRNSIRRIIETDSEIEIIDFATNGKEAVDKAIALRPDIITMDIEMPILNGLEATKQILKEFYVPIIMFSSLTKDGADATIDALNIGAIDFLAKDATLSNISNLKDALIFKIKSIAKNGIFQNKMNRNILLNKEKKISENKNKETENNHTPLTDKQKTIFERLSEKSNSFKSKIEDSLLNNVKSRPRPRASSIKLLAIGISTGGPGTLHNLIPKLPSNFPVPITIVQHMPPNFTKSLADRLNSLSELNVKEAENGELLKGGNVYVAPGGKQLLFHNGAIEISDKIVENEIFTPSFNLNLQSAIDNFKTGVLALVMTGMGSDGTNSMIKLDEIGGYNISQSPETCVVAGMTGSAIKAGCVHEIVDTNELPNVLKEILKY